MITMDFATRDGVLVITIKGIVHSGEEAVNKARTVVNSALEAQIYRVLLDERELDIIVDTLEVVSIAKEFEDRGLLFYGGRVACLPNPACRSVYRIYETAYKNRSFSYRLYDDEAGAMAWLKG